MDEFDCIINFSDKAQKAGEEEADRYFDSTTLPIHARAQGTNIGSELSYYKTFVSLISKEDNLTPFKTKNINRFLTRIDEVLKCSRESENEEEITKIRAEFKVD